MYTTETSSEFIKVSKENPCPLCDKPNWCKTSPDNTVVMCSRTDTAPTGWKRIKDTVDGHGIYKLETGDTFQKQVSGRRPTKRISKPKPAPIPAGSKLLRLPAPQRGPEPQKPTYIPEGVPASAVLITYSYSRTQEVLRFEWPDPTEPKGRNKTCRQTHTDAHGKQVWKKGDKPWSAYRIDEVIETLNGVPDDEPIAVLMLEGEPNVELARFHAIAALTLQGSSWSDAEITRTVEALRATGKNITLAKLRDNDSTGVKKGSQIQSVCDRLQFPCIVIDPVAIYPDIPDKGDIKEILDNMDADEFIRRLEEEIHRQAAESARAIELEDIEEDPIDKSPTNTNISMLEEAANEAREILRSDLDELTTNIKLEELRQAAGVNNNVWEDKIIKPLKRGMNGERFKLELLALIQTDDPVERLRQSSLMASRYSMPTGAIKEAMAAIKSRTQTAEVQVLSFDDLLESESEALEWTVQELLPVGETVLFVALPKVGKSKAAVDLAFCIATGESRFLGREVKQGKVLLICPDASKQSLKHEMLKRGFRSSDSKNIRIIPRWSIDQMSVLEKELEDFRPDLVIIDSLKKITAGKEISENSAEFADNIIAMNDTFGRYRASGVLIHHSNKSNEAVGVAKARGSTAIVGACWGVWDLERIPKPDPNNKKKMIADPKCPKRIFTATSRDSEGLSLNIEFNPENNSFDFISEVGLDEEETSQQMTYQERILKVLQENRRSLSGRELMELMEIKEKGIYTVLGRMENKRLISSKPSTRDKRCILFSLPNFKATEISDTVTVNQKISLPPPPPPLTVPDVDYYSETVTPYAFENSQHNSQQIVNTQDAVINSQIAETLTNQSVNPIVNTQLLTGGGRGVKCDSICNETQPFEQVLIAPPEPEPETAPTAPTPPTAPPEPKSTAELVGEFVSQRAARLRKAIAENDTGAIKKEFAKVQQADNSTGSLLLAVKACLNDAEKEACRVLLASHKQQQPATVEASPEPIALTDNSPAPESAEAVTETAPTPKPASEIAPEPALEPATETAATESTPEPEPEAAPVPEAATESETTPTLESVTEVAPATESAPEVTPALEPEAEPTPAPTLEPVPAPEFKVGDRVRVIKTKSDFRGKYGRIHKISSREANVIYTIVFDKDKRRKKDLAELFSASEIELIARPEVDDAK